MPINPKDYPPKCPKCGQELDGIGYTEHGALYLQCGEWLKADTGGEDTEYHCLECDHHFTYEELEELGVV